MEKRFAEAAVGTSAEQAWQTLLVKVALYFLRGECYDRLNPTTSCFWREKTAKGTTTGRKPDRLAGFAASPVFPTWFVRRKICTTGTAANSALLLICPKCDSRRAFYEDGAEIPPQKGFVHTVSE